jgi:hypothetical protein
MSHRVAIICLAALRPGGALFHSIEPFLNQRTRSGAARLRTDFFRPFIKSLKTTTTRTKLQRGQRLR